MTYTYSVHICKWVSDFDPTEVKEHGQDRTGLRTGEGYHEALSMKIISEIIHYLLAVIEELTEREYPTNSKYFL